jgi:phenylacetate-CoA ligase
MRANAFEKLKRVVEVARERSPFYRERLKGLPFERPEDLDAFPFLNKPDIYENSLPGGEGLFTAPYENLYIFASSGTTGRKKYSFVTPEEFEVAKAWQTEILRIGGVARGDVVANLHTVGHLDPTFGAMSEVLGRAGATVLLISGHVPFSEQVDDMLLFRANAAAGEPTFLLKLAEYVESSGRPLKLRKLIFVGEHFGKQAEAYVRGILGVERIVAAAYSSADTGAIGFQCDHCSGSLYHILEDYQHVELLDPETLGPAKRGEPAEVVVSNLHRSFMPLIRFRIGDMAREVEGACPCGREGRRITLLGRTDEEIMVFSTVIPTAEFAAAITSVPGLSQVYQIEISTAGGNLKVAVRAERKVGAEPPGDAAERVRKALLDRVEFLADEVGKSTILDIEVVPDGALPRTTSGKVKRVIDRRV